MIVLNLLCASESSEDLLKLLLDRPIPDPVSQNPGAEKYSLLKGPQNPGAEKYNLLKGLQVTARPMGITAPDSTGQRISKNIMANSLLGPYSRTKTVCDVTCWGWSLETTEMSDRQKAVGGSWEKSDQSVLQSSIQHVFIEHLTEKNFTPDKVILGEYIHWLALYFCLALNRHLELCTKQNSCSNQMFQQSLLSQLMKIPTFQFPRHKTLTLSS